MAVLDNLGLSGSIGEVSLYKRNGKLVVRKKKNNVSSGARSAAQERNEQAFKVVQNWVKPIVEFVKIGFRKYEHYSYPSNAARAYLKMHSLREEAGQFWVDPALAKLSMGPLPNPQGLQVSTVAHQQLQFTWDPALEGKMSPRDRIMLLAYNSGSGKAVIKIDGPYRREGTATLDVSRLGTDTCHIYAAFVAEKGEIQSESQYLGEIGL